MDETPFDQLTRAVDASPSRRNLLGLLTAGALGGLLAGVSPEDGEAKRKRHRHRKNNNKKNKNNGNNGNGNGNGGGLGAAQCDVCASGCTFTSIQAAIDAAAAGATITLCGGFYKENLTIAKTITLTSNDPDNRAAVSPGPGGGSVVTINDGGNAIFDTMAFGLGTGTLLLGNRLGGGFLNFGTLTLLNSSVDECTADQGGGIYNFGKLTLNNTSLVDNTASRGGGIYAQGQGLVIVTNKSIIDSNTATDQGGGIYNEGGLTLIGGSEVESNTSNGDGGGIFNEGHISIEGSFVQENTATGNGGGILNLSTVVVQSSSVITKNKAANGAGIYNDGDPSLDQPQLNVINSAITRNDASEVGGGIFNDDGAVTMKAGTIFANTATITGGGIFNTDGGSVEFGNQSAVVENTPDNCVGTLSCPA